jgi:hypothetical protein
VDGIAVANERIMTVKKLIDNSVIVLQSIFYKD